MKNLILFILGSLFLMSCGGAGTDPSDNITWGQAFNHVSKSFGYWIWIIVVVGVSVFYVYKTLKSDQGFHGQKLLPVFGLLVLLALAIFMRPSEVAANTTVEQAARGVYIGY